ncbi:hypothetical protein BJV78DRAFT_1155742 [Lactifluus subvellereus]|nr:hypothetical protein BJV78DRAFT_1155742 [Lactifluus subvellereus]
MRLPSSSSLLLASLAVSTSTSSLSALAAPVGGADPPAGSSSSTSVPLGSDDTTAQSHHNMQTRGLLGPVESLLPAGLGEELETIIGELLGILVSHKARADLPPLPAEDVKEQAESLAGKVLPAGLKTREEESGATNPPQDSSAQPSLPQAPFPAAPSQIPEPPVKADPPKPPVDLPVFPSTVAAAQPSQSASPPSQDSAASAH